MINWDCNAKDFELINQIAQRVEADIQVILTTAEQPLWT